MGYQKYSNVAKIHSHIYGSVLAFLHVPVHLALRSLEPVQTSAFLSLSFHSMNGVYIWGFIVPLSLFLSW